MIFVNGSNIFHACKNRGIEKQVDYEKLAQFLFKFESESSQRILVRKYYYGSQRNPPTDGQRRFEHSLKSKGWETNMKKLVSRTSWGTLVLTNEIKIKKEFESFITDEDRRYVDCFKKCAEKLAGKIIVPVLKEQERGVDVALITNLLSMGYKNAYDEAIVVGAEEDFEEALKEVKQLGKRLVIASFSETISDKIRVLPDKFIPLEKHIKEILKS
jgi:uncharacterized LabA/DUF88 family protein